MGNRRSSPKKERRRYSFQFTFSSLLLVSIGSVFILAWVFSLGIMVGRGFLPSTIGSFSFIKGKAEKGEEENKSDQIRPLKDEELTFYNQLVHKKERARERALPRGVSKDQGRKKEASPLQEERGNYSVQVAALKEKGKSEKLVERLTSLGYPAYYYQAQINDEVYYRIRCGPFLTLDEVRKCARRLADSEGFKPFIVYPSTDEER